MTVRLKSVARIVVDAQDLGPQPFVALESVESDTGRLVPGVELPVMGVPDSGSASVRSGDVLFGKLRPYLAKSWRADRRAYASTELLCIRPKPNLESAWLSYLVRSQPFVEWAVATSDGTKMPRTSWEKIGLFRLDLPSPPTQRAIANYLDRETARIDALIAAKERMVALLEERLRLLAHGLTTANGNTMPLRRVVSRVQTGATPPGEEFARLSDGSVSWYSPGDVGEWLHLYAPGRSLKAEAVQAGWVPHFPPGSTLLVGIGATAGKIAFLDHSASGNQQITCLVPGPRIVPRFLSWQLLARREEIRATAPFTTLPIINNEFIRSFQMVVPSLARQVEVLGRLDHEAARVQALGEHAGRQIALLQERRHTLITAAVTGQLNIPEAA